MDENPKQNTKTLTFDELPKNNKKILVIIKNFSEMSKMQVQSISDSSILDVLKADKDIKVNFNLSLPKNHATIKDIYDSIKEQKPYIFYEIGSRSKLLIDRLDEDIIVRKNNPAIVSVGELIICRNYHIRQ